MAGNQTPCLDCGAPLVEWGEGRCIACDLRMTLLKDWDPLLVLTSAFLVALSAEAKARFQSARANRQLDETRMWW